jgi:hypothetical protein
MYYCVTVTFTPLKPLSEASLQTERKQHATQHPYEMFEFFFVKNRTKERNERSEERATLKPSLGMIP